MKNIIAVLSIVILFTACEGNTERVSKIRNDSSSPINVVLDGVNIVNFDKTIAPGNIETLFITNDRGGSDFIDIGVNTISNFTITNSLGDTTTKDYTLESNWETTVDETKKIPSRFSHEYVFSITDLDF